MAVDPPTRDAALMTPDSNTTRATLLGRLQQDPTNESAWKEFVENYGPKIYGWCRYWKLQESDAQDITQDVLLRLATTMKSFSYDRSKSFRGWLKTLTHHAWADFVRRRRQGDVGTGDTQSVQLLHSIEARDDLLERLEAEFDRELMNEAMLRIRVRVAAQTWEAFRLTAVEGLSGAEAAKELGMPVAHVYVAKSRVTQMLQKEIARLEVLEPASPGS